MEFAIDVSCLLVIDKRQSGIYQCFDPKSKWDSTQSRSTGLADTQGSSYNYNVQYNLPFQILAPWTIWKINVKWNGSTEMVTQVEGIHIPQGFLRVRSVAYKMFEKNKKIQYSSVNHHSASFSYLYQSACHLFIQPEFEAKMGPLGRSANPVLLSLEKCQRKSKTLDFDQ